MGGIWSLAMLAALGTAPSLTPIPAYVGGRASAAADGSVRFGWPGVYVEAWFRGPALDVRFDAPSDFVRLVVDGRERRVFRAPGAVDFPLAGLGPGAHDVRLEKMTESQEGGSRFIGFYAPAGTTPLPVVSRARQIEFVGDSYTVGYGNLSPRRQCTRKQVHDLTDTQRAFGPLVARRFGADYRVIAYSGFGVVRNYAGERPGLSLPTIYPRAVPDTAEAAAPDPRWRPQVIVVNLGTNDFSTSLRAGERWADQPALRAAYEARYAGFVRDLAAQQPQARFILMGSDMFFPAVETVAAALRPALADRVATLRFAGLRYSGCDSHPSAADDRLLAGLVEQAIVGSGWWAAPR